MGADSQITTDECITCYTVAGAAVRLAKVSVPTGGVAVFLASCGNIDHYQDPDAEFMGSEAALIVACATVEDAGREVRAFIERNDLGGGNWAGGDLFDAEGQRLGQIAYNGTFWPAEHPWSGPDRRVRRGPSM